MAAVSDAVRKALELVTLVGNQWRNPFVATKAVNLTDDEIYSMYVEAKPIVQVASPVSPTPLLLTGGKGSGRTHLLRYWSYPVQTLHYGGDLKKMLHHNKYVGIYVLLGGLNASRFRNEDTSEQASIILFGHYLDLTMCSIVFRLLAILDRADLIAMAEIESFGHETLGLMGLERDHLSVTVADLLHRVVRCRQILDREVNDSIFEGRQPDLKMRAVPGEIFLELPELVRTHFKALADIRLSYLLDELENVEEPHQRHVQTLIREKRPGMSLIVGSRTYGVRTLETLTANEPNRSGSEFIEVRLDELMREPNDVSFRPFCEEIARKRLTTVDLATLAPSQYFSDPSQEESKFLRDIADGRRSPAIRRLRRSLARDDELSDDAMIEIEECLTDGDDRLLEKLALLAFYKEWRRQGPSVPVARSIRDEMAQYRSGQRSALSARLGHFRTDLVAQLRREYRRDQSYWGFETMVRLADGNPRNFMNMMQLVFMWSEIMGCDSPEREPIPVSTQARAVRDACEWFYRDSEVVGPHAYRVRVALNRLGELLEKLRFSQNLSESSLCTVTIDMDATDTLARSVITDAENWSLLVRRPNRRDRNEKRRLLTLQINRMLSPRWSLPLGRRGVLALTPEEVEAIFATEERRPFARLLERRLARSNFDGMALFETESRDTLF